MWTCLRSCEKADAETQMALDAELLQMCQDTPGAAFLRFYRMDPAAVTIGRNQKWRRVVDPAACSARGWDWVRRPTGGGALLHRHEVNYAVVMGREVLEAHRLDGFSSAFAWIARGLAGGIGEYIPDPVIHTGRQTSTDRSAVAQHGLCGRSLTRHEIGSAEGKVLAAAQMIRCGAILQHGTVYLHPPGEADQFWPQTPLSNSGLAGTPGGESANGGTALTTAEHLSQRWAGLGEKAYCEPWWGVAATLRHGFIQALGLARMKEAPVPAAVYNRLEVRLALWQSEDWRRRR